MYEIQKGFETRFVITNIHPFPFLLFTRWIYLRIHILGKIKFRQSFFSKLNTDACTQIHPLISKNQQFKKNFLQVKLFFITASFFKCLPTDSLFHVQIDLNGHDRLGDFDSIDL